MTAGTSGDNLSSVTGLGGSGLAFAAAAGGGSPVLPIVQTFNETEMGADGTTLAITKPTGTVDDNLMVAIVCHGDGDSVTTTPPAGWSTLFADDANGSLSFHAGISVFYKRAASEGASYTFTFSGTTRGAGHIIRIAGGDLTTPLTAGTRQKDVDSTINAPSVTPDFDNSLVLSVFGSCNTSRAITASPTTPTLIVESKTGSDSTSGFVSTFGLDVVTAGATAAETQTLNGNNGNVGCQIVVNPNFE